MVRSLSLVFLSATGGSWCGSSARSVQEYQYTVTFSNGFEVCHYHGISVEWPNQPAQLKGPEGVPGNGQCIRINQAPAGSGAAETVCDVIRVSAKPYDPARKGEPCPKDASQ